MIIIIDTDSVIIFFFNINCTPRPRHAIDQITITQAQNKTLFNSVSCVVSILSPHVSMP